MHRAKEAFCSAPPGSSLPPCSCDWLPWAPNASRCACAKELTGVATCFNRCCGPPTTAAAPRHLVVHAAYKVTDALLERAREAAAQARAADVQYFVSFLIGDGVHDRCPDADPIGSAAWWTARGVESPPPDAAQSRQHQHQLLSLRRLRSAVGADAVWCLDAARVEATFPGFFRSLATVPSEERFPRFAKAGSIAGFNWPWFACDVPALVSTAMAAALAPTWDYLWQLDWDVAWVGSLPAVLKTFDAFPSDLLTYEEAAAGALPMHKGETKIGGHVGLLNASSHAAAGAYRQLGARNYLQDAEVFKAMLVPARYSRRMLGSLRELVGNGRHAFCETRAPSLCKSAKWCYHRAMRLVAPQAFAPGAFGCCNKVSMGDVYWRREQWAKEPLPTRPPGMLIHRVQE